MPDPNLDQLTNNLHHWIDVREGIQREINDIKPRPGEGTGRLEDRLRNLETERADVQRKILDIDSQIRALKKSVCAS